MSTIRSAGSLQDAITALEQKRKLQEEALVDHWDVFTESLKPANILKRSIHDVLGSAQSRSNLIDSAVGLGTGLLSRKLLVGRSPGVFRKVAGTALQLGITGLIAKNADKIKQAGARFIGNIFRKNKKDRPA